MNTKQGCNLLLYRCNSCPPGNGGERHWVVDCGQHEHSYDTPLFSDAIAEALMHRSEALR